MTTPDFLPSPELAAALSVPATEGVPPYGLVVPGRPIVEDLAAVPSDALFVATRGTADCLEHLGQLPSLVAVWAVPASAPLFESCSRAPRLRALYVSDFKRLADVPLAGAGALEHLMLSWAPQLRDLSFLRALPSLRTLYLEDMKRIDLSTLPELPRLAGLHLGGTMWSTLRVESLEPLTRLPNLRYLRLANVRPADGSLRPLSRLVHLRQLDLPNFFELEEVARLSGLLPGTKGNTLTPVFAPFDGRAETGSWPWKCSTCGGPKQMMTGRHAAILCPVCDAARIERRVARWEIARAAGAAGANGAAGWSNG